MRKLPKILIVEDELRMCESLEYLLKTKDYNVKTASCGRDALALIAENTFDLAVLDSGVNSGKEAVELIHRKRYGIDLVILDMIMPGIDGGKTFDYIREKCPQIPVVLSSGYAMNGQADKNNEQRMRRVHP